MECDRGIFNRGPRHGYRVFIFDCLFAFGALSGVVAGRHGWFAGLVVGIPLSIFQMTRWAMGTESLDTLVHELDYWRILIPTCVAMTGVAIVGGIFGAWMRGTRFLPGRPR